MIAAIILAAGSSTRMDLDGGSHGVASKALLPLGSELVLERVVRTVRRAGVRDVSVVTGHRAAEVAAIAEDLGARAVHNPDHLRGMFTSVQAGVRALAAEVEAFFVLPMDCPLVRPEVLDELLRHRAQLGPAADSAILHPTCCGRRGHPPLIAAPYRQELAAADEPQGLHGFLQRHAADEHHVEVHDLTILIDMDTPTDYRRVTDFAESVDRERCGAAGPRGLGAGLPASASSDAGDRASTAGLSDDDSMYLLGLVQPAEERVRHCEAVAAVGTTVVEALHPLVPSLDVQLVRSGCLLHDIAKGSRRHAATAQILMERLGLPRLGEVVGAHMVIPSEHLAASAITEEQLVYLADKMVVKDGVAGIDERERRSLHKQLDNPDGFEAAKVRMEAARLIAGKVEAVLGRSLEDVILDVRASHPPRD
jgi:molybdenum cofactor cytidylyltransferase